MSHMHWYSLADASQVDSPALLIYRDRVAENLRRMIVIAGGADRLRPHVKTHKIAEIVRLQLEMGITQFKCATIAEAEMLARCGAKDILLAYQPTGPKIARLLQLSWDFPAARFSALVDTPAIAAAIDQQCKARRITLHVYLDLDVGMHRTGIAPGPEADALVEQILSLSSLKWAGLHAYDGHIRDTDFITRKKRCDAAFAAVEQMRDRLEAAGIPVPEIVAGGTPTFPVHALRKGVTLSPGTCVLWDGGYERLLPDLDFLHAAVVLTRVISKPAPDRLCLDLGHKSIAAENPHPRVYLKEMEAVEFLGQSEEHLVLSCAHRDEWPVGKEVYGIPHHICPTTALYESVSVVSEQQVVGTWRVLARDRSIGV